MKFCMNCDTFIDTLELKHEDSVYTSTPLGPVRAATAVSRIRGHVLRLGEKMTVLLKVGERRQKGDNDLIARCFQ